MSKSLKDSDPIENPNDDGDGQLTIRIPNPKVYMARQSQWIGRRGKPRCDYCRTSNLKCDRVLPICNHCSWANHRECIYTPLPTPAHRGIPRCDHCRAKNMKCDRNLPICNNCRQSAAGGIACNYTPKRRHKTHPENDSASGLAKSGRKNWPKFPPETSVKVEQGDRRAHTFYGQIVASSHGRSRSPSFSEAETASDIDSSHTSRFTADFAKPRHSTSEYMPHGGTQTNPPVSKLEFIPHSFASEQRIIIKSAHIEPWTHPSFVSLPDFVRQRLHHVDPVEMPKKQEFDNALRAFQQSMMEALRDTAYFSVEKYIQLVRCLADGDMSILSDRVRSWATVHRLCSDSDKYHIILAPRDSVFSMGASTAESHRRQFVTDLLSGNTDPDNLQVHHYDRLPVQNQLYDILTYAHRSHLPAAQMLLEVVRLRFAFITWPMAEMYVRMCPLCNMRTKQLQDQSHQIVSAQSPLDSRNHSHSAISP